RSPRVDNEDGCEENGAIIMWGNAVIGEAMQQRDLNMERGKSYRLSFCTKFLPGQKPKEDSFVRFLFRASDGFITGNVTCQNNCEIIGESPNIYSSEWQKVCLPIWTANQDHTSFAVSIVTDQTLSDVDYVSFGEIDNICLMEIDTILCPKENVFTTRNLTGLIQTQGSIFASGRLSASNDTEYIAGDTIRLQPGFRATEGIRFRAKIGECRLESIEALEETGLIGTALEQRSLAIEDVQLQVAPNPFANSTNIRFYLPKATEAVLTIHDLSGKILTQIQTDGEQQGWQQSTFHPEQLSEGIYYLILRTAQGTKSEKIVLLR
ncbi:MAG: T9SS type A sorting domain-containing protein, partial [Bacteroidota bacterium]